MEPFTDISQADLLRVQFPEYLVPSLLQKLAENRICHRNIGNVTSDQFLQFGFDSLSAWRCFGELQHRLSSSSASSSTSASMAPNTHPVATFNTSAAPTTSSSAENRFPQRNLSQGQRVPQSHASNASQPSLSIPPIKLDSNRYDTYTKELEYRHDRSAKRKVPPVVSEDFAGSLRLKIQRASDHHWARYDQTVWKDNPKSMLFTLLKRHGAPAPRFVWMVTNSDPSSSRDVVWTPYRLKGEPSAGTWAFLELAWQHPTDPGRDRCFRSEIAQRGHFLSRYFLCMMAIAYILYTPRDLPKGWSPACLHAEGRLLMTVDPDQVRDVLLELEKLSHRYSREMHIYACIRSEILLDLASKLNPPQQEVLNNIWRPSFGLIPARVSNATVHTATKATSSASSSSQAPAAASTAASPSSTSASTSALKMSSPTADFAVLPEIKKPSDYDEAWPLLIKTISSSPNNEFVSSAYDKIAPLLELFLVGAYDIWRQHYLDLDVSPSELIAHGIFLIESLDKESTIIPFVVERLHFLFVLQKAIVCNSLAENDCYGFKRIRNLLCTSHTCPTTVAKLANIFGQCLAMSRQLHDRLALLITPDFLKHTAALCNWALTLPDLPMQAEILFYLSRVPVFAALKIPKLPLVEYRVSDAMHALSRLHAKFEPNTAPRWIAISIEQIDAAMANAAADAQRVVLQPHNLL